MAEVEQKNNILQSYHDSSYILERIFNIKLDDNDSKKNKKEIGSEYHQVPPPLEKNYTFYDDEMVVKAFDMVDHLPENIDVTYSKSDDVGDSEVVSKVVESVLKEDSTKTDMSESQVEDEESFHKNYLKNSKSEINTNDDPIMLAYYIVRSDKLISDVEVPIQNVIAEKIDKVFKLVEIEKSKIDKFAGKPSVKSFYNKPSYQRKTQRLGWVIERNKIKRNELKRQNFRKI
ncbi:hypothetical protein HanRHA438_Chr13g0605141 [Helianthus annuus]|uniref:Uncharacterized protein n=1 Tax=Helianthus annuus TaxID=4232 RepID=A0A9K3HCF6_HELAN|nr:hypothetical protein HanXRQr2_Chr13g0594441 [Helianthus annuus]KAJ0477355.1 hypothetical protein HanHA300_Chr13g0487561 [Helianthus annuus]KAJ0481797.1 hypothetical protein HanIR_Chr13g0646741 [Helianthus annuus]KAJ0498192.1 hypothetical protein HanHA89_Chr13g0519751 [Helianthus annuus]KAJ0664195.1 hypothetical protein HanLR1_Chr13g0489611 [Helianthus annuus]